MRNRTSANQIHFFALKHALAHSTSHTCAFVCEAVHARIANRIPSDRQTIVRQVPAAALSAEPRASKSARRARMHLVVRVRIVAPGLAAFAAAMAAAPPTRPPAADPSCTATPARAATSADHTAPRCRSAPPPPPGAARSPRTADRNLLATEARRTRSG